MKQRCLNPSCKSYSDYGGRGITVCDRWLSFTNFLADMGNPPKGQTIERIDNNSGYSPDNCKFVTRVQQQNNRRVNRVLTVDGISKTVRQWEHACGFKRGTITSRLGYGWSNIEAVKTPPIPGNKPHHRVSK